MDEPTNIQNPTPPVAPEPAPETPQLQGPDKPTTAPPDPQAPSWWREILSTLGILIIAFAVAFLLITYVFRSYQVDGPSMESTLQNQDKLIIWKVPRTWARITGHDYIPKRGDIIVFNESGLAAFGQADTKQLIKRVIGLPGDHIVVNDNTVTIYNKANPKGFQPDKTLAYDKDGHIPQTTCAHYCDVTLGAGQLFVCGDNRPDSLDSRSFGAIDANQVIGQLVLRVIPINKVKTF